MENLSGSVERVTYYNPENGYSVIRITPDQSPKEGVNREGLVTVTGNLPELAPGEYLKLAGQWVKHKKHGLQFEVERVEPAQPVSLYGLQKYLGSGLLKGIGPKLADRIVEHFGEETLEVIDNQPERLLEVEDIGPKRSAQIAAAWEEQKLVKEIMIFLHSHGVSSNLAVKIYKEYENDALRVVKENPYQLARDIYGVGFKTADRIAQSLGLPADHPTRIEVGVMYVLEEMNHEGHVFTPRAKLEDEAVNLLTVERNQISPALERLEEAELVVIDSVPLSRDQEPEQKNAIYLTPYYYAEIGTARRLGELNKTLLSRLNDIPPDFIGLDSSLSEEQNKAVRSILSQPVSVLTGGPGTGKTTTIKALIAAVEAAEKRYALASPTGRAAKRLSEACGRPASTLHRLLEFSPQKGFLRNEDNPLQIDLIVVDEVSMLDIILANNLLKALEQGTHLLLVGDTDQLPSVGAGDVLRDVIKSKVVPLTRLTTIYRQAQGSQIISNAHLINQGELPDFSEESQDFFRFPANSPEEAGDWVEDLVMNRIPDRFGLNSLEDIQVMAPMYRGAAGIHALNERLQNALNPKGVLKPEKSLFGRVFRPGDKVMQVKNNYDKGVFNGDIGLLSDISSIDHMLTVTFEGRKVDYAWSEADQLVLAYAISIHKAQGSEFPAVVIPLLTQHYLMLQRNLLYTAVTRAKKLCVLVTNIKTLSIAVKNNKVAERYSGLAWRLGKG